MSTPESEFTHKAGRANQVGASLVTAKIAGNLALASSITIALLVGIVFPLSWQQFLSSIAPIRSLDLALR